LENKWIAYRHVASKVAATAHLEAAKA